MSYLCAVLFMYMLIFSTLSSLAIAATTIQSTSDSISEHRLDEVDVVMSLKETHSLRQQPHSFGLISNRTLLDQNINSLRQAGSLVPNFFMPEYGSRQTGAIYMRGVGSRIGTPSVGLYVDDVPYYDKTAFDFSFLDVEQIEILRGPQSTLYGRNTMGGLIHIHTRNPILNKGFEAKIDLGSGDNLRRISVSQSIPYSTRGAMSYSAFYEGSDGFFSNQTTDSKVGDLTAAGGRIRSIYQATDKLRFDVSASMEYSNEDSYPYFYTGATNEQENYIDLKGKISSNRSSYYKRNLWNAALNIDYLFENLKFNAVTSWQGFADVMSMDQDFLAADIYTLKQLQHVNTLSEELILKTRGDRKWNWITGASFYFQHSVTKAPVTFRKDGIDWLNSIIADKMKASPMPVTVEIIDSDLPFDDEFTIPTYGSSFFHQSTIKELLGVEGLQLTAGIRFDYEKHSLEYKAWYEMNHSYMMPPRIDESYSLSNSLDGEMSDDALHIMPKVAIQQAIPNGQLYVSASRGFRSGGYNPQSISEPLQQLMQTDMMKNVRDVTFTKVPPAVKDMVTGVFDRIINDNPIDVQTICSYRPETAWNYEIGTHLHFFEHRLMVDASVFCTDVNDLQLSKMSANGLGRTVINAGSSRSIGAEIALSWRPIESLAIKASAGLTEAKFRNYSIIDAAGQEVDCKGCHVPYMPSNTFNIDAAYSFKFIPTSTLRSLTIGADLTGVGTIWWDEQNLFSQDAYTLLGTRLIASFHNFDFTLWGRNLGQTHYNTFWFESMKRGFEQHGRPRQIGISFRFHI